MASRRPSAASTGQERAFYSPPLPECTATGYAEKVVSGEWMAGPHVVAACNRHLADLDRQSDTLWFDERLEADVAEFIESELRLFKGRYSGRPFLLMPWSRFIIGNLFGWQRLNEHGEAVRRFTSAYIETGKGSAKSPLAAAIALYMLVADGEPQSEVYIFARNVPQARVTFNMVHFLIGQSPGLRKVCRVRGGDDPHTVMFRDCLMERLASDDRGEGKSGQMPHCILADEFHEHRNTLMLNRLEAGIKSRAQPLTLLVTNSGAGVTNNHCWERHQYTVDVVEGRRRDDSTFGFVCSLDDGDDPFKDEDCWPKANPSLPWLPGREYLRGEVEKARGLPSKRSEVERLNFCIWTEAESPWIDRDVWLTAETNELTPAEERRDWPCFIGLDLANKNDLTAAAMVWSAPDGHYEIEVTPWVPESEIERLDAKLPEPVREWVRIGHLKTCGAVQDFSQVADWIGEQLQPWNLKAICYDRRFIDMLVHHLDRLGLPIQKADRCRVDNMDGDNIPILDHPQGTQAPSTAEGAIQLAMHSSIEAFERLLLTGKLKARYNPMLRSGVLGAVVTQDQADNRRFLKASAKVKIDTCVAATMALGLAVGWRDPETADWIIPPIYD